MTARRFISPPAFFLPEYGGQFACGDANDPLLIGVVRVGKAYHAASGDVNGGHGHAWGYNATKSHETPEEALVESLTLAIQYARAVVRRQRKLASR